ncbi:hypothetical protein [Actinomadura sp. 9N407]|uniref:hypothetical protein n=1 Tax=Actinomadura sp. 9N407 TaxID=3375154 RepID=UPI00378C41CB
MSMNIRRCSGVSGSSAVRHALAPWASHSLMAGSCAGAMLTIARRRSAGSAPRSRMP